MKEKDSARAQYMLGSFHKCPICKKKFWVPVASDWVYVRYPKSASRRMFCSWKCVREYDRQREEKKRQRLKELRKGTSAVNREEQHEEKLSTVLEIISRSGDIGITSWEVQERVKELYGEEYSRPVILRLIRELSDIDAIKKIEPRNKCQVYIATKDEK